MPVPLILSPDIPPAAAGDVSNAPAFLAAQARERLDQLPYADRPTIRRALRTLESRLRRGETADRAATRLTKELARAEAQLAARAGRIAPQTFDAGLPIHAHLEAIRTALQAYPVLVVSGETGSGKTTQLPRLCLDAGRGRLGRIGHTQPRRVAARAVAARIAHELGPAGAQLVGHKVRFADETPPTAAIKLLTDGMLLAESRADPLLLEYDTLIVDEAHERSLNIDFLLGRLRQLLARRPELRLIIASATLEPGRIAGYFGDAPLIEVSGRGHPVEVRYRPPGGGELSGSTLGTAVVEAVRELRAQGPGDVLVFLPGEREIRESAEALRAAGLPDTEVLALYARQSRAEQDRVFQPHRAPRVVLATNVAETSLTVPGVRYVVDSGLARIARYSVSGHMARLPVEPIAKASAIQRAGRCGRLGPGICIRLYEEADYARRRDFPEPEIRRASLAAVLLQMLDLGIADPAAFPFLDAPSPRALRAAHRQLFALGAVGADGALTGLGRQLARFPLDPRQARMLVEGERTGALSEVLVIVAGLSVPDPRLRPHDALERAAQRHRAFADPRSDFLSLLKLWTAFGEAARGRSQRKLRAWCEDHDLSFVRLREWREVESQLRTLAHEAGLRGSHAGDDAAAVHRALLAGLVDQVAQREEDPAPSPGRGRRRRQAVYRGPGGSRWHLHPGSVLARRPPQWVMAAEVVETTRPYARMLAAIEPAWLEAAAPHLLRHDYLEPHFDRNRQEVLAYERVTLLGLPVVARRRVRYARVAPQAARELFIREALVGGALRSPSPGLARTGARIEALREQEARLRRPELVVDDDALCAAWAARLPEGIASAYTFEHWRRRAEAADPAVLELPDAVLLRADARPLPTGQAYPDSWPVSGAALPLRYRFDPADEADGITATVPLAMLPGLDPEPFGWLVPGWRAALFTALIRTLPKAVRRHCVPAPDLSRELARQLGARGDVCVTLGAALTRRTGIAIGAGDFSPQALPPYLRMRFEIIGTGGERLAQGRDLGSLQAALAERARDAFAAWPRPALERDGVTRWDFGPLPEELSLPGPGGVRLRGYPALLDAPPACAVRVFSSQAAAAHAHRSGVNALLRLRWAREGPASLPRAADLGAAVLRYAPLGRGQDLERELAAAAVDEVFGPEPPPRDAEAFEAAWQAGHARLGPAVRRLTGVVSDVLAAYHALRRTLRAPSSLGLVDVCADLAGQLESLVYPGFIATTGAAQLTHLPRYLRAMAVRLERARADPARDRAARAALAPYLDALLAQPPEVCAQAHWQAFRWQVEELRVSLFAQELGTAAPVSAARLDAQLDALHAA